MSDQLYSSGMRAGTIGGTVVAIIANIAAAEIFKTAVLAAVGAAVSFGMSVLIKWVMKRIRVSRKLTLRQAQGDRLRFRLRLRRRKKPAPRVEKSRHD